MSLKDVERSDHRAVRFAQAQRSLVEQRLREEAMKPPTQQPAVYVPNHRDSPRTSPAFPLDSHQRTPTPSGGPSYAWKSPILEPPSPYTYAHRVKMGLSESHVGHEFQIPKGSSPGLPQVNMSPLWPDDRVTHQAQILQGHLHPMFGQREEDKALPRSPFEPLSAGHAFGGTPAAFTPSLPSSSPASAEYADLLARESERLKQESARLVEESSRVKVELTRKADELAEAYRMCHELQLRVGAAVEEVNTWRDRVKAAEHEGAAKDKMLADLNEKFINIQGETSKKLAEVRERELKLFEKEEMCMRMEQEVRRLNLQTEESKQQTFKQHKELRDEADRAQHLSTVAKEQLAQLGLREARLAEREEHAQSKEAVLLAKEKSLELAKQEIVNSQAMAEDFQNRLREQHAAFQQQQALFHQQQAALQEQHKALLDAQQAAVQEAAQRHTAEQALDERVKAIADLEAQVRAKEAAFVEEKRQWTDSVVAQESKKLEMRASVLQQMEHTFAEEARHKVNELQAASADYNARSKALLEREQAQKALEAKFSNWKSQLDELKAQAESERQEAALVKQRAAKDAETSEADFRAKAKALEKKQKELEHIAAEFVQRETAMLAREVALQESYNTLNTMSIQSTMKEKDVEERMGKKQQQLAELEREILQRATEVESLSRTLAGRQSELREEADRLATVQRGILQSEESLQQKMKELKATEEQAKVLQLTNNTREATVTEHIAKLNKQIEETNQDIVRREQNVSLRESQVAGWEAAASEVAAARAELNRELAGVQQKQFALDQFERQLREAEGELRAAREKLDVEGAARTKALEARDQALDKKDRALKEFQDQLTKSHTAILEQTRSLEEERLSTAAKERTVRRTAAETAHKEHQLELLERNVHEREKMVREAEEQFRLCHGDQKAKEDQLALTQAELEGKARELAKMQADALALEAQAHFAMHDAQQREAHARDLLAREERLRAREADVAEAEAGAQDAQKLYQSALFEMEARRSEVEAQQRQLEDLERSLQLKEHELQGWQQQLNGAQDIACLTEVKNNRDATQMEHQYKLLYAQLDSQMHENIKVMKEREEEFDQASAGLSASILAFQTERDEFDLARKAAEDALGQREAAIAAQFEALAAEQHNFGHARAQFEAAKEQFEAEVQHLRLQQDHIHQKSLELEAEWGKQRCPAPHTHAAVQADSAPAMFTGVLDVAERQMAELKEQHARLVQLHNASGLSQGASAAQDAQAFVMQWQSEYAASMAALQQREEAVALRERDFELKRFCGDTPVANGGEQRALLVQLQARERHLRVAAAELAEREANCERREANLKQAERGSQAARAELEETRRVLEESAGAAERRDADVVEKLLQLTTSEKLLKVREESLRAKEEHLRRLHSMSDSREQELASAQLELERAERLFEERQRQTAVGADRDMYGQSPSSAEAQGLQKLIADQLEDIRHREARIEQERRAFDDQLAAHHRLVQGELRKFQDREEQLARREALVQQRDEDVKAALGKETSNEHSELAASLEARLRCVERREEMVKINEQRRQENASESAADSQERHQHDLQAAMEREAILRRRCREAEERSLDAEVRIQQLHAKSNELAQQCEEGRRTAGMLQQTLLSRDAALNSMHDANAKLAQQVSEQRRALQDQSENLARMNTAAASQRPPPHTRAPMAPGAVFECPSTLSQSFDTSQRMAYSDSRTMTPPRAAATADYSQLSTPEGSRILSPRSKHLPRAPTPRQQRPHSKWGVADTSRSVNSSIVSDVPVHELTPRSAQAASYKAYENLCHDIGDAAKAPGRTVSPELLDRILRHTTDLQQFVEHFVPSAAASAHQAAAEIKVIALASARQGSGLTEEAEQSLLISAHRLFNSLSRVNA